MEYYSQTNPSGLGEIKDIIIILTALNTERSFEISRFFPCEALHSSVLELSQVKFLCREVFLLNEQTEEPLRGLKNQQGILIIYLNVERPPEMVAYALVRAASDQDFQPRKCGNKPAGNDMEKNT